jgi:hypothetical protein
LSSSLPTFFYEVSEIFKFSNFSRPQVHTSLKTILITRREPVFFKLRYIIRSNTLFDFLSFLSAITGRKQMPQFIARSALLMEEIP